jgi:hypothetical protein
MPGQRAVNLVVRAMLRAPGLAPILGGRLVTLYVVGRTSGRRYCVPVAYVAEGDDLLIGTSSWWGRNLRTGEPVVIRLKGKLTQAAVHVSATEPEVVSAYAQMARANPTFAKFSNIHLTEVGEPDHHDLHLARAGGARAIRLTPQTTGLAPGGGQPPRGADSGALGVHGSTTPHPRRHIADRQALLDALTEVGYLRPDDELAHGDESSSMTGGLVRPPMA